MKGDAGMSFQSDFASAIDYIEENLTGDIDFNLVAQRAKCSSYHFQRMFSSLVNIPLSEYIRRRRITLAAIEIQNTDVKIIDIAMKYGYESHSSFTRAFQTIQGITPSKARTEGATLMAYPPLNFQFLLKGVEGMKYQIKETEPFKLFGLNHVSTDGWTREQYLEYSDLVLEDGSHDATNIAAGFPGNTVEMIEKDQWDLSKVHLLHFIHFWNDAGVKYSMYGWEVPEAGVDDKFTVLDIPQSTWVVVTIDLESDRAGIMSCYNDLYVNWFPTSGYEQVPGCPIIEKYNGNIAELWMPITKK